MKIYEEMISETTHTTSTGDETTAERVMIKWENHRSSKKHVTPPSTPVIPVPQQSPIRESLDSRIELLLKQAKGKDIFFDHLAVTSQIGDVFLGDELPIEDDDKMALSSLSDGENKLEVYMSDNSALSVTPQKSAQTSSATTSNFNSIYSSQTTVSSIYPASDSAPLPFPSSFASSGSAPYPPPGSVTAGSTTYPPPGTTTARTSAYPSPGPNIAVSSLYPLCSTSGRSAAYSQRSPSSTGTTANPPSCPISSRSTYSPPPVSTVALFPTSEFAETPPNITDPHALTVNCVMTKVIKELKQVLNKDIRKKMIEVTAFKRFEQWWDEQLQARKLKTPGDVPKKAPKMPLSCLSALFDNRSSTCGFSMGNDGIGPRLQATMPRMPSFRRKIIKAPSAPPLNVKDSNLMMKIEKAEESESSGTESEGESHVERMETSLSDEDNLPALKPKTVNFDNDTNAENCSGSQSTIERNKIYINWLNTSNLCWLHSSMALLVHNQTICCKIKNTMCLVSQIITCYDDAIDMLNNISKVDKDSLNRAREKLLKVQESALIYLQPLMKFEYGKPDSAFCSLLNLIKQDKTLQELCCSTYVWVIKCEKCKEQMSSTTRKPIITIAYVSSVFIPESPSSTADCPSCKLKNQKSILTYKKLPTCLIFHFENGAGEGTGLPLSFITDSREYQLTGIILFKKCQTFNHFVTYVRDPSANKWLECDDLKSDTISFNTKQPNFNLKEIYIYSYEAFDDLGTTDTQNNFVACKPVNDFPIYDIS